MKYAVIGLGAVGNIVGGLLTNSGEDILLLGKDKQVQHLIKQGLRIKGFNKKPIILKDIKTSSDYSKLKDIDIIFYCVKSQDTEKLSKQILKHIKKSAVIVSLQNGVRNKDIIKKITKHQVISGIILFNSVYEKPGFVNLTYKGGIVLESNNKLTKEINDSLTKAGFDVTIVDNIKGYQYSKLIVNLQIAVTALTAQTIRESITDELTRNILVKTMQEGVNVVENSGIKLQKLPDIDPKKMIQRMNKLNKILINIGSRFMGIKPNARNSMWQSLSRGRPSEIDYINGEIVKLAKKNSLSAPINSKLVSLIKDIEINNKLVKYEPEKLSRLLGIEIG